jgi:hypothetical protein
MDVNQVMTLARGRDDSPRVHAAGFAAGKDAQALLALDELEHVRAIIERIAAELESAGFIAAYARGFLKGTDGPTPSKASSATRWSRVYGWSD